MNQLARKSAPDRNGLPCGKPVGTVGCQPSRGLGRGEATWIQCQESVSGWEPSVVGARRCGRSGKDTGTYDPSVL